MRPGPPASLLHSAHTRGVRAEVLHGGRVIAAEVPVADVVLEHSPERTVSTALTYRAPASWEPREALDPLALMGQRTRLTAVYEAAQQRWEVPLGEYVHHSWDVDASGVTLHARDLLQLLEDDPMPWPSSPPAYSTLRDEAQRLCPHLTVVLDLGVDGGAAVPASAQWGHSRTEAIGSLAASMGLRVYAGHDGALHLAPLRTTREPVAEYSSLDADGGRGTLLALPPAPVGDRRTPNRWVMTSGGGADSVQRQVATREDTTGHYDPRTYGWVTSILQSSGATTMSAMRQAVEEQMRADRYGVTRRSALIVPDARLEPGDLITLRTAREVVVGQVRAMRLPLTDTGEGMRVDVDVVRW